MARETLITPEGLEKLKDELEFLENDKRREVAERIRVARQFGDISENSEYDDAKNEQAMLEQRIAQMEERVRRATVIDSNDVDTYEIVGSAEADPANSRLSNESPVGRALIGHKKGETVEVQTPRGSKIKFKIMEIKAA